MRKILFTAVLLLVLLTLPVCARAWEWTLDDAGALEISGTGAVEDFSSASDAPWYGQIVRQVVIHEGITEIGSYAFRSCTKLTSVTLPDSLEAIGVSAFEGCSALKTITVGTGLRSVEEYAFQDCTALTGVYITDADAWCRVNFASYNSSPMYYAKALYLNGQPISGVLELSAGVTKVPKYAFYGCEGITELKLSDSVTVIESDAFTYCSGLTSANLGSGVTKIESGAFSYCTNLISVTMDGVTDLGSYGFAYCSKLEAVWMSNDLKQLGQRAFYDCVSLKEIKLPDGLQTMGDYAFYGCSGLQSVSIPESLTLIPAYAFWGCTGITELQLPNTIVSIEKYAFRGCSGLKTLTIPKSLKTLGNYAFYNCTGLQELHFCATAMDDLKAGNNVFYKAGQPGLTVTIAKNVTRVPAYLFYPYSTYAPNVTTVTFEKDSACEYIGKYAFANCKALKTVIFTDAAPAFEATSFNKTTVECLYPASWDGAVLQNYGGTLTWKPIYVQSADGTVFTSFEEALLYSDRLRLLGDTQTNVILQKDLYIDLNGHDLSGIMQTNGFKVYGIDSVTDQYSGENAGIFSCAGVIPETHCKVNGKRYLAVENEGYSFHRFYIGITHLTLRPGQRGVGFKAVFYGDEAVQAAIDATGYNLTLEGYTPKTQWKTGAFASGAEIRMLLQNFDGAYGEKALTASLCLRLKDGTVIECNSVTMTLRNLMEQLNEQPELLTETQKQQIAQWVSLCPTMGNWNIEKLLK